MAAEANCLLIDRCTVGKDRSFGDDTLLVERAIRQNVVQTRFKALAVLFHRLRRALFHNGNQTFNGFDLAEHIPAQPVTLALAHSIEFLHGFRRDLRERRGGLVPVKLAPFDRKYVRKPGDAECVEPAFQPERFGDVRNCVAVAAGKILIHCNDRPRILRSLRRHKNIHLAAGNAGGYRLLHRILGKKEVPRQPNRAVQIPVVHAFQFNRNNLPFYGAFGASVAGHAEHFSHFVPSPQICESTNHLVRYSRNTACIRRMRPSEPCTGKGNRSREYPVRRRFRR